MPLVAVFYVLLLGGSVVGFLLGIGWIYRGFDRYTERLVIHDLPTSPTGSVALGPVGVEGTVRPLEDPIRTPLGAEECVLYELDVYDAGPTSVGKPVDEQRRVRFAIEDERGSIEVADEPVTVDVSDARSFEESVESHEARSPAVIAYDRANDLEPERAHDRTYEQAHVRPGDYVYAFGVATDAETGSNDEKAVSLAADPSGLLFLSDRTPDELLGERRWAVGKSVASGGALAVVSLAVFLWMSGLAQLVLGA